MYLLMGNLSVTTTFFLFKRVYYIFYILIRMLTLLFFSLGSQWAKYGVFDYVFEQQIKLNKGKNTITLLSATVGFAVINLNNLYNHLLK